MVNFLPKSIKKDESELYCFPNTSQELNSILKQLERTKLISYAHI